MIKFISKLHWTRHTVHKNHNSEHYFGFYLQYSPCAVGQFIPVAWNRKRQLVLDLGFKSFIFYV